MGYDAWKTESGDDYEERMGMHHRGPSSLPSIQSGVCDCGVRTDRSVGGRRGNVWQCKPCAELSLRQAMRDDAVSRYLTQPEGSIPRRPLWAYTETSKERA